MNEDQWHELMVLESKACGYQVSVGHVFCRDCGGAGGIPEDDGACTPCAGRGEFKHSDWVED